MPTGPFAAGGGFPHAWLPQNINLFSFSPCSSCWRNGPRVPGQATPGATRGRGEQHGL